jgi:hypothetical protein
MLAWCGSVVRGYHRGSRAPKEAIQALADGIACCMGGQC